jgi:putative transposase
VASFSRPSVSDDNPFSEALFRTMKYRPGYPKNPFADIAEATIWVDSFIHWYNTLHGGIRFVHPSDRHQGRDRAILGARNCVYTKAQSRTPRRWTGATRNWTHVGPVRLNPEKRDLSRTH